MRLHQWRVKQKQARESEKEAEEKRRGVEAEREPPGGPLPVHEDRRA
jgi:hypothetical protein